MKRAVGATIVSECIFLISVAIVIGASLQNCEGQTANESVRIPARPTSPRFSGPQGKQRTEIHFDPSTNTVVLKMLVQDRNGYFIPNLHSDNFAVYENGVRQNARVDIEHAPVTLTILMEYGGRTPSLDRMLSIDTTAAVTQLVELLGTDDRVQLLTYNDRVQKLVGLSQDSIKVEEAINTLESPKFSELNLYDCIISTLNETRPIQGRKAILLISTGIDTFSKASYQDVLNASRGSDTPIYVISMAKRLHQLAELEEPSGPAARLDWRTAESHLEEIGRESGGRTYSLEGTATPFAVHDDLLENLRVRYVITYQSTTDQPLDTPRKIRIELVDRRTGGPLRIVDSHGNVVSSKLTFQESYIPARVATSAQT